MCEYEGGAHYRTFVPEWGLCYEVKWALHGSSWRLIIRQPELFRAVVIIPSSLCSDHRWGRKKSESFWKGTKIMASRVDAELYTWSNTLAVFNGRGNTTLSFLCALNADCIWLPLQMQSCKYSASPGVHDHYHNLWAMDKAESQMRRTGCNVQFIRSFMGCSVPSQSCRPLWVWNSRVKDSFMSI